MIRSLLVFLAGIMVLACSLVAYAASKEAPPKVHALAKGELSQLGTSPVIIKAVKEQNAKGMTLAQIQAIDKKWRATAGEDAFMNSLMQSECAKLLRSLQKKHAYLAEIFVMDNQGANVAMSDKTSDYWQGDEAKFQKSFAGGKGAIHVGKVKFDDSSQAYTVQVSVPVKDGGKVIGAITFGIDLDKLK